MKNSLTVLALSLTMLVTSCGEKNEAQQRRGIDYNEIKAELALTSEQEKLFDEVIAKYAKIAEESRAASAADGAKPDRVEMFKQTEERTKLQTAEVASFLDSAQLEKYGAFVAKNTRKRPRYSDELLAKIKTDLALDEQQAATLEAVNNAFERSFHDAHDFYHGNSELAKEYWEKYDAERKAALEKVLTPAQNARFLELVKDEKPAARGPQTAPADSAAK